MSDTVIKVENVSKLYRLGEIGTGTMGQDINRWFAKWDVKEFAPGSEEVRLLEVTAIESRMNISETFDIKYPIGIVMKYEVLKDDVQFTHGMNLYNKDGVHLLSSHDTETAKQERKFEKGIYESTAWIPGNFLAEGIINVSVAIMSYQPFIIHFHAEEIISFSIIDNMEGDSARGIWEGAFPGLVRPILQWNTIQEREASFENKISINS